MFVLDLCSEACSRYDDRKEIAFDPALIGNRWLSTFLYGAFMDDTI
jgi:hypothetical protein